MTVYPAQSNLTGLRVNPFGNWSACDTSTTFSQPTINARNPCNLTHSVRQVLPCSNWYLVPRARPCVDTR